MKSFDVLIVGGGPAGSAAALQCRKAGLRVGIVEGEKFPRDKPGETLPPAIEPLLANLGVTHLLFPRHDGIFVAWGEERRFQPFGADADGPWLGFHAWRADFDALLLRGAATAGAEILQPCRAQRPVCDGPRPVGVDTDRGRLECRFLLDASGSRHWLARHLDLRFQYASGRLISSYGYAEGNLAGPAAIEADKTGWTWTAQVRPNLIHWTRVNRSGQPPPAGWLPLPVRGFREVGATRHADSTWRNLTAPAGPGYFALGDAATVLDPLSSHGVLRALMSGMMAAYLIGKHLDGAAGDAIIAWEYARWLAAWFAHDISRLRGFYARL